MSIDSAVPFMMGRKRVAAKKKVTEAQDKRMDKRAGVKEGSKRDNALDRKRGVVVRKAPAKRGY